MFGTSIFQAVLSSLEKANLNFFRVHLIWFTVNPLIWSGIFYACNGRFHISYVDSLFLCISAQTVTGLAPINASSLTGFQQAILFYLMIVGNYTFTSFVMVLVRKHYFVVKVLNEQQPKTRLGHLSSLVRSKTMAVFGHADATQDVLAMPNPDMQNEASSPTKTLQQSHPLTKAETAPEAKSDSSTLISDVSRIPTASSSTRKARIPPAPLRREVTEPIREEQSNSPLVSTPPPNTNPNPSSPQRTPLQNVFGEPLQQTESPSQMPDSPSIMSRLGRTEPSPNHDGYSRPRSRSRNMRPSPLGHRVPLGSRTGTTFVVPVPGPHRQGTGLFFAHPISNQQSNGISIPMSPAQTVPNEWSPSGGRNEPPTYERGFGGFPTPLTLTTRLVQRLIPNTYENLRRNLTIDQSGLYAPAPSRPSDLEGKAERNNTIDSRQPRTLTRRTTASRSGLPTENGQDEGDGAYTATAPRPQLAPPHLHHVPTDAVPHHLRHDILHRIRRSTDSERTETSADWLDDVRKTVNYVKEGVLRVGRNSDFKTDDLTDEQLEQLGGVEYRALRALSWVVGLYWLGTQMTTFIIFTGYLQSTTKYDPVFEGQFRWVPKAWFSAFQAVSAYTGGGLTLVDQGMVPFRGAYVMVIFQGLLIIAGNMGLAIFLRLIVWILSKIVHQDHKEPFQFLLDHPRRCFLYLFPSHQTWFLAFVFLVLTLIEWFGFLILDIGLSAVEEIPLGERVLAGIFQSLAVRASGFAIVPLGALAPAVKFLYLVMMYISAYPIAMSIRSTNVYEQRSLGIYEELSPDEAAEEADPDVDESAAKLVQNNKGEVLFSKYLGMHVRRQLSYDLWWLAFAMFLICIVERGEIMNPDNETWFNQFQIMFELVSAYSTVGLSLGIPTDNFSFVGAWKPLSKLILCAVMIRGRHRDLPVAIDRAILLPEEFNKIKTDSSGRHLMSPGLSPRIDAPLDATTNVASTLGNKPSSADAGDDSAKLKQA